MDHTPYPHSSNTGNVNSYNVSNSHNNIVNVNKVVADENPEIMRWLSPLDPRRRHQDVRTDRLDGVGNGLLETNEVRGWRSSEGGADKTLLFCYGNPGVGKTYLSSLVIDNLCDEPGEEDIAIAGFYCDFRDQQEHTATNILGAILKQLVVRGEVLGHVQTVFRKAKKELGGRGLRLPEMVQLLKQTIAALPRVFICIDALDECLPKHLLDLLVSLKDILQEAPRTRVFVTGRPHVEVEITRYFTTGIIVPISPSTQEIKIYLEKKLEMDTTPDAMSDSLREDILRIIPERISEIFLLVSLNIDAILGEVTTFERRQKLNEVAGGNHLDDAYATTLTRMRAQKGSRSRLGMEALMWVSNSEQPLHISELCHALGVKIGSTDLNVENVPTIRTVLACSLGLITIEASSSTTRLVHFTLKEYLSDNPCFPQSPHAMIAEVCLTYLNFRSVRELSRFLSPTLPFMGYASCYWASHTRREKVESVDPLALTLLNGFEQHISALLLLLHYNSRKPWWQPGFNENGGPTGFTGLHGAAFLGVVDIFAALLAMREWDINAIDAMGRTALAWAAVGGHEDVVKMLLQRKDAKPNTTDIKYGRTPLSLAVELGHEGVVKLLLAREDINPNTTDTEYCQTPLMWAAEFGYEGVVKLLLEREDINPNTADTKYGRTPLSLAAAHGHQGVVKLLLERGDINPNTTVTRYCQTPLMWAAEFGYEGVVKLLLEREDIDPNTADTEVGRTPLLWAVGNGHEGVVKLLLEREDINPNTADTRYCKTPLMWAAEFRYEGVVKLLLEREDMDPNTADTKVGRTPLSWAAENGHEGVVKLLLAREDINLNTAATEHCQTPVMWAVESGHEGVVKLLLERGDIDTNTANTDVGLTLLLWAAGNGHEGVVKLLLERKDINPNIADTEYCKTPLMWAAEFGHEGVVKLLLEREDIDPNTTDTKVGRTPLSWAAGNGHEGVVKLLLAREDIDPNTVDTEYCQTPLMWAAGNGHEGVVMLLLKRDDINPAIPDREGRTALEVAVRIGHRGIVGLLSEPKPSLPVQAEIDEAPEHPSLEPPELVQSHSQLVPAPPKLLPPFLRSLFAIAIGPFIIISSFLLLFYLIVVFNPFLTIL